MSAIGHCISSYGPSLETRHVIGRSLIVYLNTTIPRARLVERRTPKDSLTRLSHRTIDLVQQLTCENRTLTRLLPSGMAADRDDVYTRALPGLNGCTVRNGVSQPQPACEI